MRDIIVSLLGEYSPSVAPDGSFLGGLASIDFTWLVGAFSFLICLVGCLVLLRTIIVSFR